MAYCKGEGKVKSQNFLKIRTFNFAINGFYSFKIAEELYHKRYFDVWRALWHAFFLRLFSQVGFRVLAILSFFEKTIYYITRARERTFQVLTRASPETGPDFRTCFRAFLFAAEGGERHAAANHDEGR